MSTEKTFNPKIYIFDAEARLREQYLQDNKLRLVTAPKAQARLIQLHGFIYEPLIGWVPNYTLFLSPATKTALVVEKLSELRDNIEKTFQLIYIDIPKSELNDEDRMILNILKRDSTYTHVELFKFPPIISLYSSNHLFNIIRIINPQTPGSTAMPHRHHCHLNVGFKATATGPIIWDAERFVEPHDSLFDVHFTLADKGKEAFIRVRYVSPTGELGDYCDAFSTIVI